MNVSNLKKPMDLESTSTEQLLKKISSLETKLTTAELDKKEQDSINHRISEMKRIMNHSK